MPNGYAAALCAASILGCGAGSTLETADARDHTAARTSEDDGASDDGASDDGASDDGAAAPSTTTHTASTTTHTPSDPARRARDRARCAEGVRQGCHAAALDAFYRPSDPRSDADALRYFTRGCDAGHAPSCNGLGVLHAQGRGVPQDHAHAARLYREACEAGASTACQHLAEALRRGVGVGADPAAAERAEARHACAFEASLGHGALEDCPAL